MSNTMIVALVVQFAAVVYCAVTVARAKHSLVELTQVIEKQSATIIEQEEIILALRAAKETQP